LGGVHHNEVGRGIFDRYRAETGVAVELRVVPFEDLDRSIRAIPQEPDPPDLVVMNATQIPTYAVSGILRPLDDVFPPRELEDFLSAPRENATWQGRFYGPAFDESSQAVFFNRGIVEGLGVEPPTDLDGAWTWPEAREVFLEVQARERERRGDDRFWALNVGGFGGPIGGGLYTGGMIVRGAGEAGSPTHAHISEDGLRASGYIDTPEALEAHRFLQGLYQADGLVPTSNTPDFFPNGQVAFWLAPLSRRTVIEDAGEDVRYGVTPCPFFETPTVHTGSFHLGVCALSENGDAAAEAVAFFARPENLAQTARSAGDYPARRSALDEFPEYEEPPLNVFTETLRRWGVPRPKSPGAAEYQTVYDAMVADVAGGAPVEGTVRAAAREIDAQLERYGERSG
jgi:ABC-type glycerol-3-phosphate transport system substrate-binding protein